MLDFLKQSMMEKKLVSLFMEPDEPVECDCGYVLGIDGERFVFLALTPEGRELGLYILALKDILRADTGGVYEYDVSRRYLLRNLEKTELSMADGQNAFLTVSDFAREKGFTLWLEYYESDMEWDSNYFYEVSDGYIRARGDSAESIIRIESLRYVFCDFKSEVK